MDDTTQLNQLVPRLRAALLNSTGGTGKASDVNFARLQAELDEISRENVLRFKTPPFFTIILRSLTILEGVALSVDPKFRLVRGSYPYVLRQLLSPEDNLRTPEALQKLLIRLLTINGEGKSQRFGVERILRLLKSDHASFEFQRKKSTGKDYETYCGSRKRQPLNTTHPRKKRTTTKLHYPDKLLNFSSNF